MPPVIYKLIERSARIYTHPHEFPAFAFPLVEREVRRSQRREALALVAMAMFLRMDLVTKRVGKGIPGTNFIEGVPITQLAAWTGLTVARTARAVQDFTNATYQTGKRDKAGRLCAPQSREKKVNPQTGARAFRSRPAARRFEDKIFRRLDLALEVEQAAKYAAKERKKEAEEKAAEVAAAARQKIAGLHAIQEARMLEHRSGAARAAAATRTAEDEAGRRRVAIAVDVWRELTDSTQEEQRAEVERRLAEEQRATGPPE